MKLSIERLKLEFKQYLLEQNIELELSENDELSGASIFEYESEFKDFVEKQYSIDLNELSFDFNELLEMDIEDGQFVVEDDNENEEITQDDLMFALLNTLLDDEEFVKKLDETDDGKLDTDEIKKFLTFSNSQNDEDEQEAFTFADMTSGVENTNKGNYKPKNISLDTIEQTEATPTRNTSVGGYSPSSSTTSSNTTKQEVQKNPYSGQDSASLKEQEAQEQSKYDTAKENYLNAQNGTHADLDISKQEVDKAQQTFIDAMKNHSEQGKKLAEQLDEILTKTSELSQQLVSVQQEITLTEQEIAIQGQIVSDSNTRITNLESMKANLDSKLSSLPAEQVDERALINSQKSQIEAQITAEKERRDKAQTQKDKLETEVKPKLDETLNTTTLAIQELSTQSEDVVTQTNELLKNNPELDALSEAYNEAQEALETKREELTYKYQDDMKTAQINLQNIREELAVANAREDKKLGKTDGNIFKEQGGKYTWEEIKGQTNLNYGVIAPENVDPNEDLPVIVFLHGMGQNNPSGLSATKTVILNDIFTSRDGSRTYDLEDFNGYIICPHSENGWYNQAENIDEVLNDFSKTHNIDPDNIVLMGHSSGGSGVIYTLDSETFKDDEGYKFKKGVALAGYPDWMKDDDAPTEAEKHFDLAAPLIVYADDGTIKADFDKYVSNVEQWIDWRGESHNYLDQRAFSEDLDGDGQADMLELVFEDEI